MTPARQKVLQFIEQFIGEKGYAPTYEDMGEGCGNASKSHMHHIVLELEREGVISVDRDRGGYGKARGIKLTPEFCPYCGNKGSKSLAK